MLGLLDLAKSNYSGMLLLYSIFPLRQRERFLIMFEQPTLIVVGGLPGTGKSTLAKELAKELRLCLFAKDELEASVVRSGLATADQLNQVGYQLLKSIAHSNLQLGNSIILDFVASMPRVERYWPELLNSRFLHLECVCSDLSLHQSRIEGRQRGIAGWYELDWKTVQQNSADYVPLSQNRLVLDAVAPVSANLQQALEYLSIRR